MKPNFATLLVVLLSSLTPLSAVAGTVGLPVTADRCAIAYALTGRAIEGCVAPSIGTQTTRAGALAQMGYFVHFDLNSNELSDDAAAHLNRLSNLLSGPLVHLCIKLIGHTDTSGSVGHNLGLSERRAKSVHHFLAGPGNIHLERLASEGRGEALPLPDIAGSDPRNRRVEILAKKSAAGHCH